MKILIIKIQKYSLHILNKKLNVQTYIYNTSSRYNTNGKDQTAKYI